MWSPQIRDRQIRDRQVRLISARDIRLIATISSDNKNTHLGSGQRSPGRGVSEPSAVGWLIPDREALLCAQNAASRFLSAFRLGLSRACLGKMIIVFKGSIWHLEKRRFLPPAAGTSAVLRPLLRRGGTRTALMQKTENALVFSTVPTFAPSRSW